jgi:hypothetical protein
MDSGLLAVWEDEGEEKLLLEDEFVDLQGVKFIF